MISSSSRLTDCVEDGHDLAGVALDERTHRDDVRVRLLGDRVAHQPVEFAEDFVGVDLRSEVDAQRVPDCLHCGELLVGEVRRVDLVDHSGDRLGLDAGIAISDLVRRGVREGQRQNRAGRNGAALGEHLDAFDDRQVFPAPAPATTITSGSVVCTASRC